MKLTPIFTICLGTAVACFMNACHTEEKQEAPVVSVQAATAQKTDISRTVHAEALVFPIDQAMITPKISSPVKKFYVNRGQKVRKGELLAELENRDLEAAAMDNKGALDAAAATSETTVGATLPQDIQKAEQDVETTKQSLDAEQTLFQSRENLFKEGALPRKDLDQARVSLIQARTQYDAAKKHLELLNAVGKQQTIKSATGQRVSAEGKYLGAQAQLGYSRIVSPIDGVITDRPLFEGEMASPSAPLLTVMDISSIRAKAHIPQSDAVLIHKGDKAEIEAPGVEKVSGKVTLISPALDPNSTTVEIWVEAKNEGQQLRPGVSAQVSVTAQTVHDALVVPASALLNATGGQAQVMVVNSDSAAQSRDVKTGIQTPEQVQILSGLNPGEQVVSEGAYGLPDKTKVKVEKPSPSGGEGEGEKGDAAKGEGGKSESGKGEAKPGQDKD
ncbi:MAG TPA: efflux RND transporter periplasmic adaptor subunit [Candidatus Angelobacter sp.]|nr:efflux RND transporter periplasmic adaptor subunit [Candidatus Angelobacter sp.]